MVGKLCLARQVIKVLSCHSGKLDGWGIASQCGTRTSTSIHTVRRTSTYIPPASLSSRRTTKTHDILAAKVIWHKALDLFYYPVYIIQATGSCPCFIVAAQFLHATMTDLPFPLTHVLLLKWPFIMPEWRCVYKWVTTHGIQYHSNLGTPSLSRGRSLLVRP